VKGFPPTCNIAGTKIFWKQVRSLKGDIIREASTSKVTDIKKKNKNIKQLVVGIALKNRVPKIF
jgi:hypothetical protein